MNEPPTASPGYAMGQMARALRTEESHADEATRQRASARVKRWMDVITGMLSGRLAIGSRTPVAAPAWVTLEVVTGGFATGRYAASGPLLPHETALARRLALPAGNERARINAWYVTEAGLAELTKMLQNRRYRIDVPEEGALLTVAWLLHREKNKIARELLDTIMPYFADLRFYPQPDARPLYQGNDVRLQPVSHTFAALEAVRERPRITAMKRSLQWMSFYDRVVSLFAETVHDDWPCQVWPADWPARARALLAEAERDGGPPARQNLTHLLGYMRIAVKNPRQLSGRDVGMIRRILRDIEASRGLPGSPQAERVRNLQQAQAARPSMKDWAMVLAGRLSTVTDLTFDDLKSLLAPARCGGNDPSPVPERFRTLLQRSARAPLEILVKHGAIPSADVLAKILPQLTSQVVVADVKDLSLRALHGAVYRAFRERRSLLLLNLAHQVRLDELPWVAATAGDRTTTRAVGVARELLHKVVRLTLQAFPQAIVPNKLIPELDALASAARLEIPLVEELAADIFMHAFSAKFSKAAKIAAGLLEESLYESYYALPSARVMQVDGLEKTPYGGMTCPAFYAVCAERAGIQDSTWRGVGDNGRIIEQAQILTTHNLAALASVFPLQGVGSPQRCFEWICQRLCQRIKLWHARLHRRKAIAYAWRQMIFFLSIAPDDTFMPWAEDLLRRQPARVTAALQPYLEALKTGQGPQLLGWIRGKDALMTLDDTDVEP